ESQGLKKSNAVTVKKSFEQEFLKRAKKENKMNEYGNLLPQFEKIYKDITPYAVSRDYFMEVVLRNNELLSVGFRLFQLENASEKVGEQGFNDRKENLIKGLESLYKDYNKNVDQGIFEATIALY